MKQKYLNSKENSGLFTFFEFYINIIYIFFLIFPFNFNFLTESHTVKCTLNTPVSPSCAVLCCTVLYVGVVACSWLIGVVVTHHLPPVVLCHTVDCFWFLLPLCNVHVDWHLTITEASAGLNSDGSVGFRDLWVLRSLDPYGPFPLLIHLFD